MAEARRVWLCLVLFCVFRAEPVNITVDNTNSSRQGKDLFDWLNLEILDESDPYLRSARDLCLEGDFYECFKHRALSTLDEFFVQDKYVLSEHVRVLRMSDTHLQLLSKEPYEYSTEARAEDSEWDKFVKFLQRRVERFVKSRAFEIEIPKKMTDDGRYSPRFVDEIYSELDTLQDKNDNAYSKSKLSKLFVPMLIIIKLFKLKLLLFLPLILGLASFKKLLGFLALVVPGLIGFFKLCKPDLHQNYGSYGHSDFYSPPHKYSLSGFAIPDRRVQAAYHTQDNSQVVYKDQGRPHELAYQAYYQPNFNNR